MNRIPADCGNAPALISHYRFRANVPRVALAPSYDLDPQRACWGTGRQQRLQIAVSRKNVWVRLPPPAFLRDGVPMYSGKRVALALLASSGGLNDLRSAKRTEVRGRRCPLGASRPEHLRGRRRTAGAAACARCGLDVHDFDALAEYVYLLAESISASVRSRPTRAASIASGSRRPQVSRPYRRGARGDAESGAAEHGRSAGAERQYVGRAERANVELGCDSKSWRLLMPQHGPGKRAQAQNRSESMATAAGGEAARAHASRPDPLGRLQVHQHGTRGVAMAALRRSRMSPRTSSASSGSDARCSACTTPRLRERSTYRGRPTSPRSIATSTRRPALTAAYRAAGARPGATG